MTYVEYDILQLVTIKSILHIKVQILVYFEWLYYVIRRYAYSYAY